MRSCTTFALRESCPIANTFALSPLACRCSHSACVDDCCEGGSYTSLRLLLFAVTNGGERCCAACTGPQPTVVDDRAHCIVDGDGHTWHVACCLMHRVDSALVCVVEESAHCISRWRWAHMACGLLLDALCGEHSYLLLAAAACAGAFRVESVSGGGGGVRVCLAGNNSSRAAAAAAAARRRLVLSGGVDGPDRTLCPSA